MRLKQNAGALSIARSIQHRVGKKPSATFPRNHANMTGRLRFGDGLFDCKENGYGSTSRLF
jgi:hypothetical protein